MRRERMEQRIRASSAAILGLLDLQEQIEEAGRRVIAALRGGGKILTAGNGGSAAESLHMAEELVGRFRGNRRSLASVSLVADTTALTCIANDFGYAAVFSRQIEGLGRPGDVLVLFSTSGEGANLEQAVEAAGTAGMTSIAVLGRDGGSLAGRADVELLAPGACTERIQETHQVILHLLLDMVEEAFE